MKTNKQILHDSLESKKNSGAEYERTSVEGAVLEAMDEYAKQQAIAFARAVLNTQWNIESSLSGNPWVNDEMMYDTFHEQSTQFIEHQTKTTHK